ncbi:unnamed protein product, partial [Mesorhabditis spiculigera]
MASYSWAVICTYPGEPWLEELGSWPKISFQGKTPRQIAAIKNSTQYRLNTIRLSLLRIEPRIIIEPLIVAVGLLQGREKPLCALFSLIGDYFVPANSNWILPAKQQFVEQVFLPAFEYRASIRSPEAFETTTRVERCLFAVFVKFAELMTEKQLKPVWTELISWAEDALKPEADISLRIRMITLLHLANHFYESFNTLAIPYFGRLIELSARVLRTCNTATTDSAQLFLHGGKESIEGLECDLALIQSIDLIRSCAKHREFFTEERADLVIQPLVAELENSKCAGHEARCVPHLADAIYQVSDAHPNKFANMLNEIFQKTRSRKPKIRYRTLLMVERLFDKIGDSIAPHLPMVMPFISELLEDENKNVADQCDKIVRLLQMKFGAELNQAFTT